MDLFIDKENLKALVYQIKTGGFSEHIENSLRLMRKQLHLVYNFSKTEVDEQLFQLWFNNLVQGRGSGEISDSMRTPPFPSRPINPLFFNNTDWNVVSSAYLCSDETASNLEHKRSVLISPPNKELDLLKKLYWGDYSFTKIYDLTKKGCLSFGWKELYDDGHCLPCTDIVIVDRYLFINPDSFENNLFPLLQRLTQDVASPINLVLFVERKGYSLNDFIRFKNRISQLSKSESAPIRTTIIVYPPSMEGGKYQKKTIPHDRILLTNYRLMVSGPSFGEYFDSSKRLSTNGMSLTIHSLASIENTLYALSLIDFFQKKVIDRIKQLPGVSQYIIGCLKSNVFKF